jgi:chitinase
MTRSVRKWSGRRILVAAVAIAAGAVAIPATQAFSAGTVTAQFTVVQDWGSGWEGKYTITNGTSSTINGWRLEFDMPAGGAINSWWDADVTRSGQHYVAVNKSWAATLAAGASFSWGFNGSGAKPPLNCTINGASCGTGAPPATTPPRTTAPPTTAPPTTRPPTTGPPPTTAPPPPGGRRLIGYFTQWGVYGRNFHVKNLHTSGTAAKLTHILYAFGNTTGGRCTIGDSYADYDRFYSAGESVDGVADTWDAGALRGNFGQFRRLKRMYPNLRILFSIGGWTWSGGFTQAAQNPSAFAESCHQMLEDPRWADVFDGIDIDWEYPNACGLTCDSSGPASFRNVMSALRSRFGSSYLVTAAITADGTNGGKIDAADYAGAAQFVNWYMPMTYDYFGAFSPQGPTAPHSPLTSYSGIPTAGFYADAAIQKLKSKGIPSNKILLGIGFYGRGWAGVTQSAPGGSATGPAPGTYEPGSEDYKVLKTRCPTTGTVGGTAYAFCGGQWWGYDTPSTISGKMTYMRNQGLGGAFFWETSGDTTNGELVTAMRNGL